MRKCWHQLLMSAAAFWRTVALILIAGSLAASVLTNLPGLPVLWPDLFWMLGAGMLVFVVHLILVAMAHSADIAD